MLRLIFFLNCRGIGLQKNVQKLKVLSLEVRVAWLVMGMVIKAERELRNGLGAERVLCLRVEGYKSSTLFQHQSDGLRQIKNKQMGKMDS